MAETGVFRIARHRDRWQETRGQIWNLSTCGCEYTEADLSEKLKDVSRNEYLLWLKNIGILMGAETPAESVKII